MLIEVVFTLSARQKLIALKLKIAFFNSTGAFLYRIIPNSLYDNRMTKGPFANKNFVA